LLLTLIRIRKIRKPPSLDHPQARVAKELGVAVQTLGNWVRQERIDRGEREGTTTEVRRWRKAGL
jgi:transposase-like protein